MGDTEHDIGGIRMDRPFKILRFGHIAFCLDDLEAGLHFFSDLLGLNVSDTVDFSAMFGRQTPGRDGNAYFLNLASDHHSVVLFPRWTMPPRDIGPLTEYISHLSWQVGTMQEIIDGGRWLTDQHKLVRPGTRDPAGANYNTTVYDVDTLPNEIYYGMDQIGWTGSSKPSSLWDKEVTLPPSGGAIEPDFPFVRTAIEEGRVDLRNGMHRRPWPQQSYSTDGVTLPRPFRVVRHSPVGLFVEDVEASLAFYRDSMGLTLTETVEFEGHRCHYLRSNTEHHSLALFPLALNDRLGLRRETICAYCGFQVQNYRQLRAAIAFLKDNGVEIRQLPAAILPGIDYSAIAIAPDGHAMLLYHHMDQIGWDGRPRPAGQRRDVPVAEWPEKIDAPSDAFAGQVFQGPIG